MDTYENMLKQVEEKIEAGFRCIKLKIGAIDFEKELEILRFIRKHFSSKEIELRVDANGAFSPKEAMTKLETAWPNWTYTRSNSRSAPDNGKRWPA